MFMLFILFGVIAGVLGAMGLGGGTVLIPLLSLVGVWQKSAQVINIFSFVVMAFFILVFNIKKGYTKVFEALAFSFFGVIFAIITSLLVKDINSSLLKILFGTFLSIIAIVETISFFIKYKSK
jgi:uncharacterized protein